jgi:hypothetical protein
MASKIQTEEEEGEKSSQIQKNGDEKEVRNGAYRFAAPPPVHSSKPLENW